MENLLSGIILVQAKVFFREVVDAVICPAIDNTHVDANQLCVDPDDIVLGNFFRSPGWTGRRTGAWFLLLIADQLGRPILTPLGSARRSCLSLIGGLRICCSRS